MENRREVMQDYFKLRVLLNRTTLIRDQKTEIELLLQTTKKLNYRLIATLAGIRNPKHIEICKTAVGGEWTASGNSSLRSLEDFFAV